MREVGIVGVEHLELSVLVVGHHLGVVLLLAPVNVGGLRCQPKYGDIYYLHTYIYIYTLHSLFNRTVYASYNPLHLCGSLVQRPRLLKLY